MGLITKLISVHNLIMMVDVFLVTINLLYCRMRDWLQVEDCPVVVIQSEEM